MRLCTLKITLPILMASLLTMCAQAPLPEQGAPRLVDTKVVADAVSAELKATFDHADNIKEAGFELLTDGGRSQRCGVIPDGNSISTTVTALTPETEYRYFVFWSNGSAEIRSEEFSFRTAKEQDNPQNPETPDQPDQPDSQVNAADFDPAIWKLLLEQYDTNADGQIQQEELDAITELVLSDILLQSQAGLEKMPNLESVWFGNNWLSTIDLSANKNLKFVSAGQDLHLKEIILDNPNLIQTYFIGDADVRRLDFSRCPMLYDCQWYGFPLESVDLSQNTDLYRLSFYGTHLKEIDLSSCWKLRHLTTTDNPELTTIWLKQGIIMETLETDPQTQVLYK